MKFVRAIGSLGLYLRVGLLLFLTGLIFPGSGLGAATSENDATAKLIEGAKKEGQVVWYTSIGLEDGNEILKRFHEKYPFINVKMYRTGSENMLTRVLAEAKAGKQLWDVICTAGVESLIIQKKGLLAKYQSPHRPYYAEGFKDREGYWTDLYVTLNVVGYNVRLVPPKEIPRAWEDLLHPRWKGKMGMDTKAFEWFGSMVKIMGEEKGLDYMKRLAEQNITFRTGRVVTSQLMAAGELAIGITQHNQRIEEMKKRGAPIEWVALDPVIPEIHPMMIYARAPHPNAARLFVDYLLSREGQTVVASFYRIPSRRDVEPIIPGMTKGLKILPYDTSIADNYEKIVQQYRKIFLNVAR